MLGSEETPIQLNGAFIPSLDEKEELDWVESEFVRGQRNNS